MENWVTIRNLKSKNPEMGTRKIADLLGVSRNTVRSALNNSTGPEYKRRVKINPDLEPFYDLIDQYHWQMRFKGSRILNEIKSKGYKGSQSAFYRYFSKIKDKTQKSYHPYETGPGEQGQFDWSPYTVWIENLRTRIYVYGYILGFSRYINFEASLSVHQESVFEALENSFSESGGVPERVQTDNASCFVTNASKGQFKWNSRYLCFCGHYSFKPTRSLPGHPWSKGKVEKPFSYLETHFIQGAGFESFEDFYSKLKAFQDRYKQRVHSVTKAAPEQLFIQEKKTLLPLPAMRYVSVSEEVRKVTADCLISFNGNRYSVPWMSATKMVWIKVSKGFFLEIYSQSNKLIARHKISLEKGQVIMLNEHYRGHKNEHGNWKRLITLFNQRYPDKTIFLDKLQAQKRINARYHLGRILEIGSYYKVQQVTQAINAALEYNVFNFYFLQGYLENHFQHDIQIPETLPVRRTYEQGISVIRDLNTYALKDGGCYEA